jgi:hypothetical protein
MDTEKRYIQGFNSGYLLAKHDPALLSKIITGLTPTNDYLEGLFEGKEQLELENTKSQLNELQKLRSKSKDKTKGLEDDI